ncbi:NfeD family protein [Paludibaculum fermentans]|uniref:Nodulation protein NfeD n=1 Tax=Paludibaculum fermentans TaxID=1473598 RepID=A0A7S7NPS7_PALFE|nr:nodulation protein NfeD [Paludibaculum fermentans]QOY87059.1 nodulation protein NfeD [Paludibaculum fermentans]
MSSTLPLAALLLLSAVRPADASCVVTLDVDSVVHPVTVDLIDRSLIEARNRHCSLLLLRLNTPGGYLEATRSITELIISSTIPVAVYVSPGGGRAASAGFLILQAADIAVMAPGTHTGAAHPISLVGTPDEVMKKKLENDTAAALRTLTDRRGRNSALAQKAVLESVSFTDQEALSGHLIDFIARNDRDLLTQLATRPIRRFDMSTLTLDLHDAELIPYQSSVRQRIQLALSDPNIALALTLLGALCLYIEFSTPGLFLPGVAGALMLLTGLFSLSVLPLSWSGAALLLLAVAFFGLELKFPTHGVLGAGGAVAMVFGALLLVDSPLPELRVHLSTALALVLPFTAITAFLVAIAVRARLSAPATGRETYLGARAVTLSPLQPEGQILFHGEIWRARSTEPLPAGASVRITSIDGLTLDVEAQPPGD